MTHIRTAMTIFVATAALVGCERHYAEPILEFPGEDVADAGPPPPPPRLNELIVADRPPPPISGATLAVSPDGAFAVAGDPDRDRVHVVTLNTDEVRSVVLTPGSEPGRVALDAAGRAHVALRGASGLVAIELATGQVVAQTTVCQLPRGVAFDPAERAVWVACASGELVALDPESYAERSRTFVALDLRDVVITPSGQRFVSSYRSAALLRIGAGGEVAGQTAPPAFPAQRFDAFDPTLDEMPFRSEHLVPRPRRLREVTMSPTLAWRTIADAEGNPLMLHQQAQDEEVIVGAGGYGGQCQTIAQAGVTRYDAEGVPDRAIGMAGAALAVDVAASPDGRWLAFARPGAYLRSTGTVELVQVSVLESSVRITSFSRQADPLPPAGQDAGATTPPSLQGPLGAPSGTVLCGTGGSHGVDFQATSVAFDGAGQLYVLSREPAELAVYEPADPAQPWQALGEPRVIALSTQSVRDTGHELFHADVGSGLACASCHGEALDDGHVWTFHGFGPRRTQTMRGGLSSTFPLHWEGDLPSFQHLVDEVMTRRMGGFAVEPRYASALLAWLDKQPVLRLELGASDAAARGRTLFESAEVGCASCHAGEALTNNESVDVGTGGLFQVPSLRGLGLRAPFMHDGCAKTLRDRFLPGCGGGDQHGKTSQLSDAELADLVAYLERL